jgi:O-antigen biosynthesis protein WbqP
MYSAVLKRALDLALAVPALVLLSPVLLLAAAAIRLEDGGPVLFAQQRVGRHERPITVHKFRSMPVDTRDVPSSQARELRITRVGKVIRRTNIDELPQLLDIVRGDMSAVGPRPALAAQEELVALRRANGACALKPGLTGAAQVNAYDDMPESEKAAWDGWYAARVSLGLDLLLILRTVGYLAKRPPTY